jgi:hypothetical protein
MTQEGKEKPPRPTPPLRRRGINYKGLLVYKKAFGTLQKNRK